ncbi:hypothetical protein ACWJKU_15555 [Methylocaldum sp. MU1018]
MTGAAQGVGAAVASAAVDREPGVIDYLVSVAGVLYTGKTLDAVDRRGQSRRPFTFSSLASKYFNDLSAVPAIICYCSSPDSYINHAMAKSPREFPVL